MLLMYTPLTFALMSMNTLQKFTLMLGDTPLTFTLMSMDTLQTFTLMLTLK
jgi:hypothetical protein